MFFPGLISLGSLPCGAPTRPLTGLSDSARIGRLESEESADKLPALNTGLAFGRFQNALAKSIKMGASPGGVDGFESGAV